MIADQLGNIPSPVSVIRMRRRHMINLQEDQDTPLLSLVMLLVSLLALVVVFLPFASDTSPLDALTLHVPGNQGNWWHALVGAPFFLALPMIWVRFRSLASKRTLTPVGRRLIWIVVGLSTGATIAVETPFLLHLAGTSEWQRLAVLCLGLGIVIASGAGLLWRRKLIPPTRACLIGLDTAYLASAALCLVVYSNAEGPLNTRSGWLTTMILVWPMALEVIWSFIQTRRQLTTPSLVRASDR
jgi:hypothetical protein